MPIKQIFLEMKNNWPSPVVARERVDVFSGYALTPKYMANLDARGEGVPERFRIGRKVVYPVDALVEWLSARAESVPSKKRESVDEKTDNA